MPKPTGADMRSGPASLPLLASISAAASSISRRMRCARGKNASPALVKVRRRVERWSNVAPNALSNSASLSLTTDFASPGRAAALIEVWSTVATKAVMPSSFIIVRFSRRSKPEWIAGANAARSASSRPDSATACLFRAGPAAPIQRRLT
jgi:hypothetical protein